MTSKTNTLPFDKVAEQFVLGAMLCSVNAVNHCIPQLDAQDFYFTENQAIFQAISDLYRLGHTSSAMNVAHELKANKGLSWDHVLSLEMNASGVDYEYYLPQVINASRLRKLIYASNEAAIEARKEKADSQEVIAKLQNQLFQAQGLGLEDTKTPKDILDDFCNGRNFQDHTLWAFDQIRTGKQPYSGVPSGYPLLDKTLGFFRPGCYYTIGARTSMGKTTFLLNLIKEMNFLGRITPVGFFSLEMPANIIAAKLVCMFAGIKYSAFDDARCTVTELENILSWGKTVQEMPIYIEDQSGITISQVRARAKRMLQNYGIKILFIDYLTLIKPDNKYSSNHLAVNEVSKGIQQLAKELQIPIVVLAQLNRQVTGRTDHKPNLADFRESGSIEEDSDACLLLHRPEYYTPGTKTGIVELYIAKNRLRGELKKLEYNVPYGECYRELETIDEAMNTISENKPYFPGYKEK